MIVLSVSILLLFIYSCLIAASSLAPYPLIEPELFQTDTIIHDTPTSVTITITITNVNGSDNEKSNAAIYDIPYGHAFGEWGLSYVLSFCISDPKCRGVNKTFKRIFDKECEIYLTDKDPRFRQLYTFSKKNKLTIPPLPLQVPLAYLFSNYLNEYHVIYSSEFKDDAFSQNRNPLTLTPDTTNHLQDFIQIFLNLMKICNNSRFQVLDVTDVGDAFNPFHFLFYYRTVQLILPALRLKQFPKRNLFPFSLLLQLAASGYFPLEESKEIIFDHFNVSSSIALNDRPIFLALRNNQIDLVSFILERFPDTLNSSDSKGRQPIHYAAALGNLELFNKLVELGADVKASSELGSVICIAATEGRICIIERIVKLEPFWCAFFEIKEAIIKNHIDIIHTIITHPHFSTQTWNLVGIAALHSHPQTLRFLLNSPARVDRSRDAIKEAIKQARLRYPVDREIINLLDNYLRDKHQ